MSTDNRRDRKRAERKAKEAGKPAPPVPRYRKPFVIPVLVPSKILRAGGADPNSGMKTPQGLSVEPRHFLVKTPEDLLKLIKEIMEKRVMTPPAPIFMLQILELILKLTDQLQDPAIPSPPETKPN